MKTAILVDGGFYKKQAKYLFGEKSAKDRADELVRYCLRHIDREEGNELYRIFYYDCYPSEKVVYHPLTGKGIDLSKSELFRWNMDFFNELTHKRKLALRKA